MNRLSQIFCVLGVAAAGLTPVLLYAEQGHLQEAASVSADTSKAERVTVAVWTPPARDVAIALADTTGSIPVAETPVEAVYADALPNAYEGDYDDPLWAVVTHGTRLHADPDVSSPTTWFYGVGAKLHVVGYRGGWYHVIDPETSRRGFIFARHYLEAMRGPDAELPVIAKTETPVQTALAEPAPAATPVVRHASRAAPYLLAPAEAPVPAPAHIRPARQSFVAARPGSVTSLLNQAIRR